MSDLDEELRGALQSSAERFVPEKGDFLPGVHRRARALRARAIVWALIIVLFIASGTFIGARVGSSPRPGSLIGPPKKDQRDPNYVKALEELQHLLNLAILPPGSTRT